MISPAGCSTISLIRLDIFHSIRFLNENFSTHTKKYDLVRLANLIVITTAGFNPFFGTQLFFLQFLYYTPSALET